MPIFYARDPKENDLRKRHKFCWLPQRLNDRQVAWLSWITVTEAFRFPTARETFGLLGLPLEWFTVSMEPGRKGESLMPGAYVPPKPPLPPKGAFVATPKAGQTFTIHGNVRVDTEALEKHLGELKGIMDKGGLGDRPRFAMGVDSSDGKADATHYFFGGRAWGKTAQMQREIEAWKAAGAPTSTKTLTQLMEERNASKFNCAWMTSNAPKDPRTPPAQIDIHHSVLEKNPGLKVNIQDNGRFVNVVMTTAGDQKHPLKVTVYASDEDRQREKDHLAAKRTEELLGANAVPKPKPKAKKKRGRK